MEANTSSARQLERGSASGPSPRAASHSGHDSSAPSAARHTPSFTQRRCTRSQLRGQGGSGWRAEDSVRRTRSQGYANGYACTWQRENEQATDGSSRVTER